MVRGKVVKVSYFQEQGLRVFLEKLEAKDGWTCSQILREDVQFQT